MTGAADRLNGRWGLPVVAMPQRLRVFAAAASPAAIWSPFAAVLIFESWRGPTIMFSNATLEPDIQAALTLAFEAAWRELQLSPGGYLTPVQETARAELAERIAAAAAGGERDPLQLKLTALRAYRPGLPLA